MNDSCDNVLPGFAQSSGIKIESTAIISIPQPPPVSSSCHVKGSLIYGINHNNVPNIPAKLESFQLLDFGTSCQAL